MWATTVRELPRTLHQMGRRWIPTEKDDMIEARGRLDFHVVRLPARDAIPHEAVRELLSLVEAEIVAVVDLVLIERGDGTAFTATELRSLDPRHPLSAFIGMVEPLLTMADLRMLARSLPPSTVAAVLVVEHVWARVLDETLETSECSVVCRGPIGPLPVSSPSQMDPPRPLR